MNYSVTNTNIHIQDSYKVTDTDDMHYWLNVIRSHYPSSHVWEHRSMKSLLREWKTHNRLYRLGIAKSHTKDVDLNYPQKWYVSVIYFILGL